MLSNNKGHDLLIHLKATANIAKAMAEKLGLSQELIDKIYAAALLHDIGKVVSFFQSHMLITSKDTNLIIDDDFQDDPTTGNPLHHEISWAYLTGKLGDKNILNSIYWHHARPIHTVNKKRTTFDTVDDILNSLNDSDKETLNSFYSEIEPLIPKITTNPLSGTIEVPNLFEKDGNCNRDDNAEFMLVRSCLISADRHVSALSSINALSQDFSLAKIEVENLLSGGGIHGEVIRPIEYTDDSRYNLQTSIIDQIGESKTSIIKAPAGFGKTLIGVLWAKARGSRTIWVCPRNAVADAVYDNIIREIGLLGLSCSVELFRTGSIQKTTGDLNSPVFSSDIVVTNIDTVMSPMVNNGVAGRLFSIFGANVVLDEFHEFVSEAPLFAAFITYMRSRHRLSNNCKTLLLSATPSLVNILWDTSEKQTLILPNNISHYPPQHAGIYEIKFSEKFPDKASQGSLLVCNSVSEAQNNFISGCYTHIVHHRYTDCDRKKINDTIKNSFGKNKDGVNRGESLSAALVVQAAMDISFCNLFDSVCSPESTLQRIGRTDRWGSFQKYVPKIVFMDMSNKRTEAGAINTVYDMSLQTEWYNYLKQSLNGVTSVTLSKMYEIYNSFYQINGSKIKLYLLEQYKIGMNGPKKGMEFIGLVGFTPIKQINSDPNKKSSCKNLRNPDGSYFYTVELDGQPNTWISPDDDDYPQLNEGHELFDKYIGDPALNTELLSPGAMRTRVQGLVKCGFIGWSKYLKGKGNLRLPDNIKDWFKKARDFKTPLPDFSRKYNSILGVIKK